MPIPDRHDPEEHRRELEDLELRRGWYGRGGGGWVWWWIWLMLLVIAFFWFAGWGWWGYGGWWWGRPARVVQPTSGSGVAVLDSNQKAAYIGKPFDLRSVTVQVEVNNRVFWVTDRRASPMLLVVTGTQNNISQPAIAPGDLITTAGTVEKAPPAAQAKQEWNLSNQGAQRLEQQQAYLQSPYVSKLAQDRVTPEGTVHGQPVADFAGPVQAHVKH